MLERISGVSAVKLQLELNRSAIAEVVEMQHGNPTKVLWKQRVLDIAMASPSIFGYELGSKVLIQNVEHEIVVVQLIVNQGRDHPVLYKDNNTWVLSSEKDFDLKVGNSLLRITNQGQVLLQGEDITTNAEGLNRILGNRIELN
ncbi:MAG: hypothetical protein P8X74_06940 [Reinekea sp.]|jgi:hypothetical protein